MTVFAEAVDDGEDDRLPIDPGKGFDEVEPNVCPHHRGNRQRHEQPRWVEVLGLVTLARAARPYELLHNTTHVGKMKISAKTVEGALDALMAVVVDRRDDLLEQRRSRWNVKAPVKQHHVIRHRPWRGACVGPNAVVDGDQGRIGRLRVTKPSDEVEVWCRHGTEGAHAVLNIMTGQGIDDGVHGSRLVFDSESEAE